MLKNQIKKIDDINLKIMELKEAQNNIEINIAKELVRVLKSHNGFEADFEIITGGFIDVLTTSDEIKKQKWKEEGGRFLNRKRSKKKPS